MQQKRFTPIVFYYFFVQLKNRWTGMSLRMRIEILLLFLILFPFLSQQLTIFFQNLLQNPAATPPGMTLLIAQVFLLLMMIGIPFIYTNLVPQQAEIRLAQALPFSRRQAFSLILLAIYKYQIIAYLILLPVTVALGFSAGLHWSVLLFLYVLFVPVVFILLLNELARHCTGRLPFISLYLLFTIPYFTLFFLLYYLQQDYFIYSILVPVISGGWLLWFQHKSNRDWDRAIRLYTKQHSKPRNKQFSSGYDTIPGLYNRVARAFFKKEILAHLRNRSYIRLKLIRFALLLISLIVVSYYAMDNLPALTIIITCLFIWEHFSHQFNEKYVFPDGPYLIKTLPLKMIDYALAKFTAEFIFVLIFLLPGSVFLVLNGFDVLLLIRFMVISLVFASLVLMTIVIVRLMFYDKPRFAGYIYHLIVIFCVVMTVNFYFVGPIVSLLLFGYLAFIAHKRFSA